MASMCRCFRLRSAHLVDVSSILILRSAETITTFRRNFQSTQDALWYLYETGANPARHFDPSLASPHSSQQALTFASARFLRYFCGVLTSIDNLDPARFRLRSTKALPGLFLASGECDLEQDALNPPLSKQRLLVRKQPLGQSGSSMLLMRIFTRAEPQRNACQGKHWDLACLSSSTIQRAHACNLNAILNEDGMTRRSTTLLEGLYITCPRPPNLDTLFPCC